MSGDQESLDAGAMFREEIHALIRRYGQESDITFYQVIGAMRVVEHDLVDLIDRRDVEEQ